eukprot:SAG11_NODE_23878_length_381_cov_13.549645_1_plen_88_part_10
MTMQVENTKISVVRTAETFASFLLGIVVGGALTIQASGMMWGSNVYIGVLIADTSEVSCAPCDISMTAVGMYTFYQETNAHFKLPGQT